MNAAEYWFARATIAATVSQKCKEADIPEAAIYFGRKAVYFLALGIKALAEFEELKREKQ